MDGKEIISKLQCYTYNSARLKELQEELQSICCKVTPTYGNLAPSTGGGFNSKVEDIGNRRHDLKKKMRVYELKIAEVRRLIEHSGLDEREKALMWWIAKNGKLQAFARREHIGKDNVYKIRDRAVRKILAAITPQNVV